VITVWEFVFLTGDDDQDLQLAESLFPGAYKYNCLNTLVINIADGRHRAPASLAEVREQDDITQWVTQSHGMVTE